MRSLRTMLLVPVLAVAAVVAPAPAPAEAAPAGNGAVTWALAPADAANPDGRVSLRHEMQPGGTASDHVALTNFSAQPVTFDVYASDGTISPEGSFDLKPAAAPPTDGGAWVTVGTAPGASPRPGGGITLAVPAQATVVIPLAIAVPARATPGDHPAGVVAELKQPEDGSVHVATRVGVRLHLRVTGDILPRLQATDITTRWIPSWNPFSAGRLEVSYTVTNMGNVRLGDTTAVTAKPAFIKPARATTKNRELLPGNKVTEHVSIPLLPLVHASGAIMVAPQLVGDDSINATLSPWRATFGVWMIPWSQLAALCLLAAAVVLVVKLRRRSASRTQAAIAAAVAAATAGTAVPMRRQDSPERPRCDSDTADG